MNGQSPDTQVLTIAELAKRFDLPESTARFYCKRFRDFLPHVGTGKRRRYRSEVLEIFPVLLREMEERKNASAVEIALAERYPRYTEFTAAGGENAPAPATHAAGGVSQEAMAGLLRVQGKALQDIAASLERLEQRDANLAQLSESLQQGEARIKELELEMANLRRLQDESERIHQQDLEQLRKWLTHLAQEQTKGQS